MLKKILIFPSLAIVVFVLVYFWFVSSSRPVAADGSLKDFLIVKGSSATQIGVKLQKEGLLKSPLAFKLYVQATGKQKKIQAGEYRLSPGYSLFGIVEQLTKGPLEIWVTIPEGYRREEIALKFAKAFGHNQDSPFVEEFLAKSAGKEGFLFPDTYLFPKTASASAVVSKLLTTFANKIDEKMKNDILTLDYSLEEMVTLASLIERETKTVEEKPIVTGILYKRLKAGWPLQVDAALQYAKSTVNCQWWEPITSEDKKINSPFNTYKYKGLPPTPIANPGLASIKAAIYPQDSNFWFYLHDSQGKIHYAKTIEEHNSNIKKYLN